MTALPPAAARAERLSPARFVKDRASDAVRIAADALTALNTTIDTGIEDAGRAASELARTSGERQLLVGRFRV